MSQGRNERCNCGSGLKYKNCCGSEKSSHFLLIDLHGGQEDAFKEEGIIQVWTSKSQAVTYLKEQDMESTHFVGGMRSKRFGLFKQHYTDAEGNPMWKYVHA